MRKKYKQEAPWQIRKVPKEVRTAVTKLAKKRNQTIGLWITNAIIEAMDREGIEIKVNKQLSLWGRLLKK